MTVDEALRLIEAAGTPGIAEDQRAAWHELMPATWRAAFSAGWQQAADRAARV